MNGSLALGRAAPTVASMQDRAVGTGVAAGADVPPRAQSRRVLQVAVLVCEHMSPDIAASHGAFADIFRTWLASGARRFNSRRPRRQHLAIRASSWDVTAGEYPPALHGTDALVVTGSVHGVYDDAPWIPALARYIQGTRQAGLPSLPRARSSLILARRPPQAAPRPALRQLLRPPAHRPGPPGRVRGAGRAVRRRVGNRPARGPPRRRLRAVFPRPRAPDDGLPVPAPRPRRGQDGPPARLDVRRRQQPVPPAGALPARPGADVPGKPPPCSHGRTAVPD